MEPAPPGQPRADEARRGAAGFGRECYVDSHTCSALELDVEREYIDGFGGRVVTAFAG